MQRSHVLVVLSNPKAGSERAFRKWYLKPYQQGVLGVAGVLSGQTYEMHEVDISSGRYPGLPYRYLALYELSLDGAESGLPLIGHIQELHSQERSAETPATWLYYPLSERVGRRPTKQPSLLTIAFANAVPGQERAFREWYATRHIRHALNIPALVSGQCFERTEFQSPGSLDVAYTMIAVYEQEGTPEEMIASFTCLPSGTLDFPAMDLSHFAEWVYRPLAAELT
jgi:hypothetical protein